MSESGVHNFTCLGKFIEVSMKFFTNTDWIFLIMIACAVVRSFTPAFCCISMRLRHIKLLVSPTFPVKLDAEVWIAFTFGHLSTAVIGNKIKWIILLLCFSVDHAIFMKYHSPN